MNVPTHCIYLVTNKVNDKKYVGYTNLKYGAEKRFQAHIQIALYHPDDNRKLPNAMRKYGVENFTVEEICRTNSPLEEEMRWVAFYKSNDSQYGYNMDPGGTFNYWLGKNRSGESNPMFGKGHSEEAKSKMRKKWANKERTGRKIYGPMSQETKDKISKANKGKTRIQPPRTPEHRLAISQAKKGKPIPKGRNAYEIICPNKDVVITRNLQEFCEKNELNFSAMVGTSNGTYNRGAKSYKGYQIQKITINNR